VTDALRATAPGAGLVRGLTTAPDLDGWLIVERLLEDLASLRQPGQPVAVVEIEMLVDDSGEHPIGIPQLATRLGLPIRK
jgi:hypothetical protein